jgi:hypothetical protein
MEPRLLTLVTGRDYPHTYRGFVEMFPDDVTCAEYLAKLRWPEGFVCSSCGTVGIPGRPATVA